MPVPLIVHGGPVVNDWSTWALSFPTASDKQTVRFYYRQRHSNSHVKEHLQIIFFLFISEDRGEMFLSALSFASSDAVDGVDHRIEVFPLVMEGGQVLPA